MQATTQQSYIIFNGIYQEVSNEQKEHGRDEGRCYWWRNQKYPDSLDATGFKKAVGVSVEYQKQNGKYVIASVHDKGTKLYQASSEDAKIYQRDKSNENASLTELQK